MRIRRVGTKKAYDLVAAESARAVAGHDPVLLVRELREGRYIFTAARFNGRDHLLAAIEMLKLMAAGKDIPPKVAHHVDQAICELRRAAEEIQ